MKAASRNFSARVKRRKDPLLARSRMWTDGGGDAAAQECGKTKVGGGREYGPARLSGRKEGMFSAMNDFAERREEIQVAKN